jgi:ApaG protein
LREILPGYKAALALGSRHAVDELVRVSFREGLGDAGRFIESFGENSYAKNEKRLRSLSESRLDDAISAHGLLRRRAQLLESMAADTNSDTTSAEGVRVSVRSALVPEASSPTESSFVFSYTVNIQNVSCEEPVQVVSRHWVITDEEGHVEEVRGTGVVGFQPVLEKGHAFEYTSQAPLRRLKGSMGGSFLAVGQETGRVMEVPVGDFALGPPKRSAADVVKDSGSEENENESEKDSLKKTSKGKGRKVDRSARLAR